MKVMIKKNWSFILMLLVVGVCIVKTTTYKRASIRYSIIPVNAGWGYNIIKNDSVYIHQPFIPTIAGSKVFITKTDAANVAALVVQKLKQKKNPAVYLHELDSCDVTY